jgi:hypothetical protein
MGVEYDPIYEFRDLSKERSTLFRVDNIDQARKVLNLEPSNGTFGKQPNPLTSSAKIGMYKGFTSSMDEGWTRLVFDNFQIPFRSVSNTDIRSGVPEIDVLVLPADSESTIVNGLSAERYPAEFAGGIGKEGVDNLKKFVERGGRLVCFDDSCELVMKHFGVPVRNALSDKKRNEFYNPGSIVSLDVDKRQPLAAGLGPKVAAYFSSSSAFEIAADARVRVIAKYAAKDALLSGWMLGEKYLNGKAALVEVPLGKGSVVMFAFRPQHRGQSWATFPFIFNALEK